MGDIARAAVPIYQALNDLYDADGVNAQQVRFDRIQGHFTKKFNRQPSFYVRSPGRVNLIGEHIDYSGFAVLPMALDRDVVVAAACLPATEHTVVHLANTNPLYADAVFVNGECKDAPGWTRYVMGPYRAVLERPPSVQPVSFCLLIDGDVPAGAGVSSSAAMSCSSALAISYVHGIKLSKADLIETAIQGETYAGLHCGGMDQSISVLGQQGSALLIHFHPSLHAEAVPMPVQEKGCDSFVFVVANTLVVADKLVSAPTCYNLRVVEMRLVSALLAKKMHLDPRKMWTCRSLMEHLYAEILDDKRKLMKMVDLVQSHIKHGLYSMGEVSKELDMTIQEIQDVFIGNIRIQHNGFKLHDRVMHVLHEAMRVFEFRDAAGQSSPLESMGNLMNASHASCRDLFGCSCKELDELTTLCRAYPDCFGSRLTGAGWCGCVVSLIRASSYHDFVAHLHKKYYASRGICIDRLADVVFGCRPSGGSALLVPDMEYV